MIENPNAPTRLDWFLRELWSILGYVTGEGCGIEGEACGYGCGHEEPYGWVPEACCPIHDSERRWHGPVIRVLLWATGCEEVDGEGE